METNRRLRWALIVSILLHLCLWISTELRFNLYGRRFKPKTPSPSSVIRFNLIEPPLVMETPEVAKEEIPVQPTNILSDKNVVSQDKLAKEENINDLPYAEGKSKIKDLTEKKESSGSQPALVLPREPKLKSNEVQVSPPQKSEPLLSSVPAEEKSRIELAPSQENKSEAAKQPLPEEEQFQEKREEVVSLPKEVINVPLYDNRLSKARSFGEITFNAKKHEVAPYIIKMKKRIEEHWAPPVIFTYYGLTSGETVIQFKIMPDGEVRDIKVVQEKGDESLKKSSLQAILDSSPFDPIPAQVLVGEKEKYLGITFTFYYIIEKHGEETAEGD